MPATAFVRPMTTADLPAVMVIEGESQPSPWTEKIFAEELAREWARLEVVVLPKCETVVAFCNYWLVADELQLLNICCSAQHRREGYGHTLMRHMLAVAKERGTRLVTLEVRVGNAPAIALYERMGFAKAGVRPKYYSDNREDALVMLLELGPKDVLGAKDAPG